MVGEYPMKEKKLKPYKVMLRSFVFLFIMFIAVVPVKAQGNPIEAEILPLQGNANTNILIRFNTKNATIGNVEEADIFWDDFSIVLNQQGVQGADGSYNYNLTVPSELPLSDVGNHTIRVDSSVVNYGRVTFNFTFTITEFIPSLEYLALNDTYYSLLTNYTALLNNYNQLLANYSTLSANFSELVGEHGQLLANYNSLTTNYNSLAANYNLLLANYNLLSTSYNNLHLTFSSLLTNYTSLQGNFESLGSDYDAMIRNYDSLNSSYFGLESNYEAVLGQLAFSRNLNYVLITSTIILAVVNVYFVTRRSKSASNTRH